MEEPHPQLSPPVRPCEWSWAGVQKGLWGTASSVLVLSSCFIRSAPKALLSRLSQGGGRKLASKCLLENLASATGRLMAAGCRAGSRDKQPGGRGPTTLPEDQPG